MKTIEERADEAIYEPTDRHPLKACEVVAFARGYELGATEQKAIDDELCKSGEASDGYHTFNELYDYRMLYNAAFFNKLAHYDNLADGSWKVEYDVHKSKKHSDGEDCFGGGWFIVMAELPTGQISNHYEMKYWDLFKIPEKEKANVWDGHTPKDAADRLREFLSL